MANFNNYSNYDEKTAYTSVVFGSEAPLLEVELNEMQQIFNSKLGLFLKSWGNILFPLGEDSVKLVGDYAFTVKNCVAICDGLVFYIDSIGASYHPKTDGSPVPTKKHLWVAVKERDITSSTTLRRYGFEVSDFTVENKIKDSRYSAETTRRKGVQYMHLTTDDDTAPTLKGYDKFLRIGTFTIDPTSQYIIGVDWNIYKPITSKDLENLQVGALADAVVE